MVNDAINKKLYSTLELVVLPVPFEKKTDQCVRAVLVDQGEGQLFLEKKGAQPIS